MRMHTHESIFEQKKGFVKKKYKLKTVTEKKKMSCPQKKRQAGCKGPRCVVQKVIVK